MANGWSYIATNTTTQCWTGPGVLKRITLGETAAGAITVYDEIGSGTTTILAVLKASVVEGTYEFDIAFGAGLKVVTAGASKLTVVFDGKR